MKTYKKDISKKIYLSPKIEVMKLDNEISLALASAPPLGPGESSIIIPDYLASDPFKNQIG